MPMPPPKPSTEGPRDRQVTHELSQMVRALRVKGPMRAEDLAVEVGAPYWEPGRWERALQFLVADGLAYPAPDGRLAAS